MITVANHRATQVLQPLFKGADKNCSVQLLHYPLIASANLAAANHLQRPIIAAANDILFPNIEDPMRKEVLALNLPMSFKCLSLLFFQSGFSLSKLQRESGGRALLSLGPVGIPWAS